MKDFLYLSVSCLFPKGLFHSTPRPSPLHRGMQMSEKLLTHTHCLVHVQHIHTHFSCLTQTQTQLVSQLTHSLLCWVVLERQCQGDDRPWKFSLVEKRSEQLTQLHAFTRENPSFPFGSAFSAPIFYSRSGHTF